VRVSDITIEFPWWTTVAFVLIEAFWPLTIAAAGAVIWVCLARRSRAARIVAVLVALPWLVSAGMNLWLRIDAARTQAFSAAYDRAHQRTLATDGVVAGMRLPAGTIVTTDEKFNISSLELATPAVLFGVPLKGTVTLRDAKLDGSETLARDATIAGLPCAADGGASFDDGRLTGCRLAHAATIAGIPCRSFVNVQPDFFGCELAAPYARYGATWSEGTDVRGNDDDRTFTIGARASSLRVYGLPLPQGTMVVYHKGAIAMVTLTSALSYRGCKIARLQVDRGVTTADVDGPCSLRALANGHRAVPNI
jgi:hypothetical protein